MRILYGGRLNPAGTCLARMRGLAELGHMIMPLDFDSHISCKNRIVRGLYNRFLVGPGITALNRELIRRAQEGRPDLVWVDQGAYFWPETLKEIKTKTGALLVHHNTDDIVFQKRFFRHYLQALDLYDAHFTSNLHNVEELGKMTTSYVGYNELGYDDSLFRPMQLGSEDQNLESDIFFIGHWEKTTEASIRLMVDAGLPVTIRGPYWPQINGRRLTAGVVKSGPIFFEDYVKAINGGKIGLGLVSKWNRNATAGRIFEIPACGTLLLAEKNPVLAALYEDGKEAVFYSTPQEMIEKARYFLHHPEEREAIAAAGRRRCQANQCSWRDRVAQVLRELQGQGILDG